MKTKLGADLRGLSIEMSVALRVVGSIYKAINKELVVTCGLNGNHMAGSLHYSGNAVDIRTRHLTTTQKFWVLKEIKKDLLRISCRYTIVEHKTHFHIQFKPKLYTDLMGRWGR